MSFQSLFYLVVYLSVLSGANYTPAICRCRPLSPAPQPCGQVSPIMLDGCGPDACPLPPINAPPIQTPLVTKPLVALPSSAPPPTTIANTCHCIKTVVKPQVVQQLITVPTIHRFIQTTHTPVVENIHYHGIPINCPPYVPEPIAAAPAPASVPACTPPAPVPVPPCAPPAPAPVAPCAPPAPAPVPLCAPPAPVPVPPCAPPAPVPVPLCAPPAPAAVPVSSALSQYLALTAAKPPASSLLTLLLSARVTPPACAPACAQVCAPPAPALPPCMPCLPVARSPTLPACLSIPPHLLKLLSKVL